MAYLSDYTAGTITVAANGTTVTGDGTGWQTAQFREGDWFIANGFSGIVASVDSETQLTLDSEWQGGELTAAPYRLRYMSDGSRASAQARQLIDMLTGAILAEIAGITKEPDTAFYIDGGNNIDLTALTAAGRALLNNSGTPVADRFAYLTGADSSALAPITAFGRSLLGSAAAANARTTLGLGSAALTTYEEGTWTPVQGSTRSGDYSSATGCTGTGTYRRIGRFVIIDCNFTVQGVAAQSITSPMSYSISGLPFDPSGDPSMSFDQAGVMGLVYQSIGGPIANLIGGGFGDSGAGTMYLVMMPSAAGSNASVQSVHYVTGMYYI